MPCARMALATHTDGYTHAWLAASDPGELSAAQGWDYERALRTETDQFGDEWRDCVRISVDDGRETWLDYRTGEMETRASTRVAIVEPRQSPEIIAPGEPLMPTVLGALAATITAFAWGDATTVAFIWHGASGFHLYRTSVNEEERSITCCCAFGAYVPEARRPAIGELLLRLNSFPSHYVLIMDSDSGRVSALSSRCIDHPVCSLYDIYMIWHHISEFAAANCEAIMRVAFGGMSPYEYTAGPWSPDKP